MAREITPPEVYDIALSAARALLRRRGVVGAHIGQRLREGRYVAQAGVAEVCVVVLVEAKLEANEVREARRRLLPSTVTVSHQGMTYDIPLDVQERPHRPPGVRQGLVGGQIVEPASGRSGAIGLVVSWQGTDRLMVAAHVAGSVGDTFTLPDGGRATVSKIWLTQRLDHAVLTPGGSLRAGQARLVNGPPLTGIRPVNASLIGVGVLLNHANGGAVQSTVVRDIYVSAPFYDAAGKVVTVLDLVATDSATMAGDSGTLLYDHGQRAIGTLVGVYQGKSYFLPCDDSLARISATPIL